MTINELINNLEELKNSGYGENKVVIPVTVDGSHFGASPVVHVENVRVGFDWDSGKIFLDTKKALQKVE